MFGAVRISQLTSALATAIVTLTAAPAFAGIVFFDTTASMRSAAGYPITNTMDVDWAYANRSAEAVCAWAGYARGVYTGAQLGELMGIHCFTEDMVGWQDIPYDVGLSAWWESTVTPIGAQKSFRAEAAAHEECGTGTSGITYDTGFLTGHHNSVTDNMGLVCINASSSQQKGAYTNDTTFPAMSTGFSLTSPWPAVRSVANQVCQHHGFETGFAKGAATSGTAWVLYVWFTCIS